MWVPEPRSGEVRVGILRHGQRWAVACITNWLSMQRNNQQCVTSWLHSFERNPLIRNDRLTDA